MRRLQRQWESLSVLALLTFCSVTIPASLDASGSFPTVLLVYTLLPLIALHLLLKMPQLIFVARHIQNLRVNVDGNALLPVRHRWWYALVDIDSHPRSLSLSRTVFSLALRALCIVLMVSAVVTTARSEHGEFCRQMASTSVMSLYGIASLYVITAAVFAGVDLIDLLRASIWEHLLSLSICVSTVSTVALVWLAAKRVVSWTLPVAVVDVTFAVILFAPSLFRKRTNDEPTLYLYRDVVFRMNLVPAICCFSAAWIKLEHQVDNWLNWLTVFMPLSTQAIVFFFLVLWLSVREGFPFGKLPLVTYANLRNVESAWSRVRLGDHEWHQVMLLRDNAEFNSNIATIKNEVAKL